MVGLATGAWLATTPVRLLVLLKSVPIPISIAIPKRVEGSGFASTPHPEDRSCLAQRSKKVMILANQAMHQRP